MSFSIHEAAQNGNHNELVLWLEQSPHLLEEKDSKGFTPLDLAVKNVRIECIKELIDRGAKVDGKYIFFASSQGNSSLLNLLLSNDQGVDVNIKERKNLLTPLHIACDNGHSECIKILLQAGADVNAKNKKEETPLHSAVRNGNPACVQLLMNVPSVNTNISSLDGYTPVDIAKSLSSDEVLKVITRSMEFNKGSKTNNSLRKSATNNNNRNLANGDVKEISNQENDGTANTTKESSPNSSTSDYNTEISSLNEKIEGQQKIINDLEQELLKIKNERDQQTQEHLQQLATQTKELKENFDEELKKKIEEEMSDSLLRLKKN